MTKAKLDRRKIDASWVADVRTHGNMLYIPIPKRVSEYYDIKLNDTIAVEVKECQRHVESAET